MSLEHSTSFQLAPGETNLFGEKVSPSLLTPYMKGELMCSSTRFVYKMPNTVLGLIPVGSDENTIPLKSISSVNVSSSFRIGRFLFGAPLAILGFLLLSDSRDAEAIVIMMGMISFIIGILLLAMCFPAQLNIVNHAGGTTSVIVSIVDKARLEGFVKQLQARVFADLEAGRHDEAMAQRLMQTQLQQMHVQQMQNQPQSQQNQFPTAPEKYNN